jgi:lysophospholipase L1-like esterase
LTKKIILLQVGINDFHWISTIPKSQKKQIITNLKNNIESLVSQFVIHENKVILTTIFPPQQPSLTRYIHWPENGYDIIKDLNEHIRSLSLKANVKLLDSHKLLVSKDLYSLNYTFEDEDFFLHINQRGYQALNKELNKILFQF